MEKDITLRMNSRKGRYNFANPQQESYSIAFQFGDKTFSVNLESFYEVDNDFLNYEEAVGILNNWLESVWISSKKPEIIAIRDEIEKLGNKINIANDKAKIIRNEEKIKLLLAQNESLKNNIKLDESN